MSRHHEPDLPGLVNGPVLVLAGLLAAPAYVRLAQGLLTVQEALTRSLIIIGGCVATWAVIRMLIPVMLGRTAPTEAIADTVAGVVVDGSPATGVVEQVDGPVSPAAALELDVSAADLIELSHRNDQA